MKNLITIFVLFLLLSPPLGAQEIRLEETDDYLQIDTDLLQARIRKKGYVSGIAAGSFLDKKTGAKDLGFGLHIMDFLLGPGWKDDDYLREPKYHGNLPKHYIEGPQICTQAKKLDPEIIRGKDFLAVRMSFRFTQGHNGYQPGSLWEQTLIFKPGKRWIFCGEKITSANDVDNLIYRIDMPGHIKHKDGDTFTQVYLSHHGTIPAKEFTKDFPPDARFLYQRRAGQLPDRMIRAYQVKMNNQPGPWLAGMTLDPALVVEGWCHQRGYICFIQELHGRQVKAGQTISTAYIVGYFNDLPEMHQTYDQFKGIQRIEAQPQGISFQKPK
jgi:hypothetical protein